MSLTLRASCTRAMFGVYIDIHRYVNVVLYPDDQGPHDPIRLRLYTLIAASDDEVCACSFVAAIGRSQPTVSHHLKILRDSGLVTGTKRGTWVWYRANPDIATEVTQLLPARISA
ncbi:MAG: ArsR family transcriptional regulator [Actinobacteria bacterium]|nr:ArsR family transcriptional regulator [Actinomycetota bacterium]